MSNIIPPALVRRLGTHAGFDTEAFEAAHAGGKRISSIRVNPAKKADLALDLSQPVPWCDTGYYLPERPVFTLDPLFHAGCYYVQEASSMFVAHAIKALGLHAEPLLALDLCAAPGGKSTLLNAYIHQDSLLVSNEPIKSRVTTLTDNMIRWGDPNTVVTNNDASAFSHLPGFFDLMMVDAPCSGSGMFRKDPGAIDEWSEANVRLCSERQQRILASSLPALKTDGILLYSTCSYSAEENEEIADWLCETQGLEPVPIPIDAHWGIVETRSAQYGCPGYRFYPHRLQGEGFFLAAFRKVAGQPTFDGRKLKPPEKTAIKNLKQWIANPTDFITFSVAKETFIFPEAHQQHLRALQQILYLRNAGTCIGHFANAELIPSHDLALCQFRQGDLPTVALDRETALQYLRKGNLPPSVNPEGLAGWAIVTHNGASLGWIKLLPNRINNYYPKEWRILMAN